MPPTATVVPRGQVSPEEWDAFAYANGGWVWHTQGWLDYCCAMAPDGEDRSYATVINGQLDSIVPLLVRGGRAEMQGEPLPEPLPCMLPRRHKQMARPQLMRMTEHGWWTRVVDTSRPLTDLWRELRGSIKPLIHRAEERYDIIEDWPAFLALRQLYAMQRADLPVLPETAWLCLESFIVAGDLQCFAALDNDSGYVAGAVAIYAHGEWSYYGHGRSAVPNVNDLLLWHVMTHPPARWFEVGWMERPGDDAKARAIAFHKRAFGGEDWWVPVYGTDESEAA